jgi:hypothetical protein
MDSKKFYDKAKSYMKLAPDATYIVWSNPTEDTERQTKARAMWLDYLDAQGLQQTASTFKAIWGGNGKAITVPSEDPRVFDLSYHPAHDAPRTSYGARWQAKTPPQPKAYRED